MHRYLIMECDHDQKIWYQNLPFYISIILHNYIIFCVLVIWKLLLRWTKMVSPGKNINQEQYN